MSESLSSCCLLLSDGENIQVSSRIRKDAGWESGCNSQNDTIHSSLPTLTMASDTDSHLRMHNGICLKN